MRCDWRSLEGAEDVIEIVISPFPRKMVIEALFHGKNESARVRAELVGRRQHS